MPSRSDSVNDSGEHHIPCTDGTETVRCPQPQDDIGMMNKLRLGGLYS